MDEFDGQELEQTEKPKKLYDPMTVESCLELSVGALCRNLLHPDQNGGPKRGTAYLYSKSSQVMVGFRVIPGNPVKLKIIYPYKGEPREQLITILTHKVKFGQKPFLVCSMCSKLFSKLYLRPTRNPNYFYCRNCLELHYEVQSFNRRLGFGEIGYRLNRVQKVDSLLDKVKRRVYKGNVTKPMLRWVLARHKWLGEGANRKVMSALNKIQNSR